MSRCYLVAAGRAGSCSQGRHGNLPAVPYICAGPLPTFYGTSSTEFNSPLQSEISPLYCFYQELSKVDDFLQRTKDKANTMHFV